MYCILWTACLPVVAVIAFSATAARGQESTQASSEPPPKVTITQLADRLRVPIDGDLFAEYIFQGYTRPVIYPIIGPHGIGMPRNWPMKDGVSGESRDHVHQKPMFFAHGRVNGVNFFSERYRRYAETPGLKSYEKKTSPIIDNLESPAKM